VAKAFVKATPVASDSNIRKAELDPYNIHGITSFLSPLEQSLTA